MCTPPILHGAPERPDHSARARDPDRDRNRDPRLRGLRSSLPARRAGPGWRKCTAYRQIGVGGLPLAVMRHCALHRRPQRLRRTAQGPMQNPGYGALSDAFSQSDLIFYVSKVASISPTGAPATGHELPVAKGRSLPTQLLTSRRTQLQGDRRREATQTWASASRRQADRSRRHARPASLTLSPISQATNWAGPRRCQHRQRGAQRGSHLPPPTSARPIRG